MHDYLHTQYARVRADEIATEAGRPERVLARELRRSRRRRPWRTR